MSGYGWTAEQTDFLRKHYGKKGPTWVGKRVGKSKATTYKKACSLGIGFGDVPGYVLASEVARVAGATTSNIIQLGGNAGVLKVVGSKARDAVPQTRRALVKQAWADAYLRDREEREANEAAGYLTTQEVLGILRIGFGTLQRAVTGGSGSYLAGVLGSVRRVRGTRNRYLFNPHDIEAARSRLEADRVKARGMVSVKSIVVDSGLRQPLVHHYFKGCVKHRALVGGRIQVFVRPEDAQRFLGEHGMARAA
jgi:hypothetical protein